MLTYGIRLDQAAKAAVRLTYQKRFEVASAALQEKCLRLEPAMKESRTAEDIYRQGAKLLNAERGYPSLFAHFDHGDLDVTIMSTKGEVGTPDFPAGNPVTLMEIPLNQRLSMHFPDISGLDRRPDMVRYQETGGREFSCRATHPVELIDDVGVTSTFSYFSYHLTGVMPEDFIKDRGAVLVTPLGIDRVTMFGYGMMWEYREQGPFSMQEIQEARLLSTLFTKRIIENWMDQAADFMQKRYGGEKLNVG